QCQPPRPDDCDTNSRFFRDHRSRASQLIGLQEAPRRESLLPLHRRPPQRQPYPLSPPLPPLRSRMEPTRPPFLGEREDGYLRLFFHPPLKSRMERLRGEVAPSLQIT